MMLRAIPAPRRGELAKRPSLAERKRQATERWPWARKALDEDTARVLLRERGWHLKKVRYRTGELGWLVVDATGRRIAAAVRPMSAIERAVAAWWDSHGPDG